MPRQDPTAPRVPSDPGHEGGGGVTGATGSLTPDDADEAFIPAETREFNVPPGSADVTTAMRGAAETLHPPEPPIGAAAEDEPSAPNDRDGGYGTRHGLAGDDPAYRMERRSSPQLPGTPGAERRLSPDEDRF